MGAHSETADMCGAHAAVEEEASVDTKELADAVTITEPQMAVSS